MSDKLSKVNQKVTNKGWSLLKYELAEIFRTACRMNIMYKKLP